jgi:hypothetical protein
MKKKLLCRKTKRILRLPDLNHARTAVLNTLGSPDSQRSDRFAVGDFVTWYILSADTFDATECLNFYRIARNPCRSGFTLGLENPSASARNVLWMAEIGLADVDVLWKYYNFAVYRDFRG